MLQNLKARSEVLIVGAGPVGLVVAAELYRLGIKFRIIDKAPPRPDFESRALGVHTRTLEVFERISPSLLDAFLTEGIRARAANFYGSGKHLFRIPLESLDVPYPFALLLGQAVTERLLLTHLSGAGVVVERPTELISLAQDERGVRVTLRHADGRTEISEPDYVVGADGAHSQVRKLLGADFAGHPFEGSYIVADVAADWLGNHRWPANEIHTFMNPDAGLLIFGPLPGGKLRFVTTTKDQRPANGDVSLQDVQRHVDLHKPDVNVALSALQWSSLFRISSRLVQRMRHGRVFLSGDAAHIHSPESGQGMNGGIQDATNLAWKLALTIKGAGGDALLDSYHSERFPVVSGIVRETERIEKVIEVRSRSLSTLRDQALQFAGGFSRIRRLMANAFAANLYHYRGSSIVAEKGRSIRQCLTEATRRKNLTGFGARLAFKSAPRAGDRAPDAGKLSIDDRTEIRLFGLWKQDPRLKLLILSGLTARPERWAVLRKLAEEMKNVYTDWIDVLFIAPYDIGGQDMIDGEAELHDRYGASDECMYLIRPDGYVSFRSQPVDADALSKHLQASLGISALRPTGR